MKVAHVDREVERSGKPLKLLLPPRFQPCLDRFHREYGPIVIDPDTHEAVIGSHVIDAVRDGFASRISGTSTSSGSRRLPFLARVLEVTDQLLLLGVYGDHGNAASNAVLSCGVDVLELRIAIRVLVLPSTDLFGACRL